jgi:hypothetical protein
MAESAGPAENSRMQSAEKTARFAMEALNTRSQNCAAPSKRPASCRPAAANSAPNSRPRRID